jgi:hypothetical protein
MDLESILLALDMFAVIVFVMAIAFIAVILGDKQIDSLLRKFTRED